MATEDSPEEEDIPDIITQAPDPNKLRHSQHHHHHPHPHHSPPLSSSLPPPSLPPFLPGHSNATFTSSSTPATLSPPPPSPSNLSSITVSASLPTLPTTSSLSSFLSPLPVSPTTESTDSPPPTPATPPKRKWWQCCCCYSSVQQDKPTQMVMNNSRSAADDEHEQHGVNSPRISVGQGTMAPFHGSGGGRGGQEGIGGGVAGGEGEGEGGGGDESVEIDRGPLLHGGHLLPPQSEEKRGRKCLVLDLDETLVHSSFKQVPCDFIVPVKIEGKTYKVYVAKRPYVDEFLKRCGELYEVVIFTASLAQYADPVVDLLDVNKVVDWRLFRESCTFQNASGVYVKDMFQMGRDISQIMIIDNSAHSYAFNPENAFPCETWYSDPDDRQLLDFIPILENLSAPSVTDTRVALRDLGISPPPGQIIDEDEPGDSQYEEDDPEYYETESSWTGSELDEDSHQMTENYVAGGAMT